VISCLLLFLVLYHQTKYL